MDALIAMADAGAKESSRPPSTSPLAEQEQIASVSILLQILMLGLAFVLGHILRRHKFYYLHEASASLLIGIFAGVIANISNTEERFRKWFNFHEEFFFLFLLPPIIFQSGFSLQPKPFFSNFGAICTFAVLGTFIASVVTGILVYLGGVFFLMYKLTFQESLIFGSLISATDPVTVLGIFQELGSDVNLYALVFGESVLNDAVAISLYRSFMSIRKHPSAHHDIIAGGWNFLVIFVGSMSTGGAVALICALLFKYAGLAVTNLANLECCMIVLFPYAAYMLAEGVGLSGIVAILFCGILMKHYTFSNLSESAQTFTTGFFHLISSLAETFVFIYMGVDIAIEKHSWSHVGFIFFSVIFILVARAANVFPSAYIVNYFRSQEKQIPDTHQKALWFAGLRGAMAFALALQSVHDLPPGVGRVIVTTTTAIVVLTVLVIGGATSTMLEKLDVVGDNHDGPQNHGETLEEENERLRGPSDEDDGSTSPTHNLKMKLRQFRRNTNFSTIDKNFLKPFFTVDKEEKMLPTAVETANGSTQTSNGQPRTTHHPNTSTDDRDRRQPSSNVGVQIDPRSAERSRQTSSNVSQFKDSRQRSLSPLERTTTSQEGRPPYKSRPSL
ncbi:ABC-2 type transport system permease protein [Marchantia polymorpha subsp. ruderalis]|uniref:Sodium/hydrogen exchanger n=2 Tax=Marchantia polymorpha TaxID=3197 RepID=A0AAF6ART4_MARPO|nr:hypothetical protein MARPO_0001s0256 [Marchantia polymorpha]PTQ50232.1 hypothetical protein MARPO_0001s0256 [Marchantia polymorpha]BBM99154.1 hypothetical protein Mp_1g19180 [Marchantia polymorpha subsp. ruderalis]BBM99155.1 hypothetical protein Mp_1g19180 [Marchantia polymorpha subsp. ruderalis]|eukprot:PTQ50231.1 hypothetical protein MARPO_0001s0256 [Marchantia polymorpha]